MDSKEIMEKLQAPFADDEIEWRLSNVSRDKMRGMALAYITNRAIQKRLDDVFGLFGWRNVYQELEGGKGMMCGIAVWFEDRQEWITKWDAAQFSDIEPVKGAISDSMKRAAVQWGMGRDLYSLPAQWVDVEPAGKSYRIAPGCEPVASIVRKMAANKQQSSARNTASRQQPNPEQQNTAANNTGNSQKRPQNAPESTQSERGNKLLTDKQINRLNKKIEAAGQSPESVLQWMQQKAGGKTDPQTLTRAEYDELCAALDAEAARRTPSPNVQRGSSYAQNSKPDQQSAG